MSGMNEMEWILVLALVAGAGCKQWQPAHFYPPVPPTDSDVTGRCFLGPNDRRPRAIRTGPPDGDQPRGEQPRGAGPRPSLSSPHSASLLFFSFSCLAALLYVMTLDEQPAGIHDHRQANVLRLLRLVTTLSRWHC